MPTSQSHHRGRTAVAICFAILTQAGLLGAQAPVIPQPVPNTLRGIVTDTLGAPLADVLVLVTELRRQVRTQSDGRFLFDSVKAGTYEVRPRRLGSEAEEMQPCAASTARAKSASETDGPRVTAAAAPRAPAASSDLL